MSMLTWLRAVITGNRFQDFVTKRFVNLCFSYLVSLVVWALGFFWEGAGAIVGSGALSYGWWLVVISGFVFRRWVVPVVRRWVETLSDRSMVEYAGETREADHRFFARRWWKFACPVWGSFWTGRTVLVTYPNPLEVAGSRGKTCWYSNADGGIVMCEERKRSTYYGFRMSTGLAKLPLFPGFYLVFDIQTERLDPVEVRQSIRPVRVGFQWLDWELPEMDLYQVGPTVRNGWVVRREWAGSDDYATVDPEYCCAECHVCSTGSFSLGNKALKGSRTPTSILGTSLLFERV